MLWNWGMYCSGVCWNGRDAATSTLQQSSFQADISANKAAASRRESAQAYAFPLVRKENTDQQAKASNSDHPAWEKTEPSDELNSR